MEHNRLIFTLIPFLSFASLNCQENCEETAYQCCEFTPPSCRFETSCGYRIFVDLDGLFWNVTENGLVIAQTGVPGPGPQTEDVPPTSYNFKGKIERIEPDWDLGFRLGLGYHFLYDEWDIQANWTRYHTTDHKHIEGTAGDFLLNLWGHTDVVSSDVSSSIKVNWELQYDTLDFELSRAFGVGRCFCLRPYFGIRAALIDQDLRIKNDAVLLNPRPDDSLSTELLTKSDFTGAGFRFGLDGRFDFFYDMSLFAIGSYSLLYGKFDADFQELSSGTGEGETVTDLLIADANDRFSMGLSSLQLSLGLQWNRGFCCDRYRFGLHLAWEQNLWFQLNQMNHFLHRLSEGHLYQENGNLSFQGLIFGARFDF